MAVRVVEHAATSLARHAVLLLGIFLLDVVLLVELLTAILLL
jgi:hypothetical protein